MINSTKRRLVYILTGLLLVAALAACSLGGESTANEADTGGIPEVAVEKTADGVSMASEVPSGIVALKIDPELEGLPGRLNDGVTMDDLNAALTNPEDPFAALAMVTLLGAGSNTTDGRTIYDLEPGQYAYVDMPENAPPSAVSFTAGDASGATAPEAEVTVNLVDFNFAIPAEIESGPQVWQINNQGEQWHEMAVMKMNEGVSMDDVMALIMSEESQDGPPPLEQLGELVAFWAPSGPGETAWVTWDLEPGNYTVLCFLPDITGDFSPHLAHGMFAELTVTE